jgi:hypothetical protein
VEIRVRQGRTVTELTPGNDRLRKQAQAMAKDPDLIYRRLNFPEGVPREYEWTGPDEALRQYGGIAIQRVKYSDWLEMSRTEEERGTGHVGASLKGVMPRPKERGGCECPACTAAANRISQEEAKPKG